ncbi:ParA family protein [Kineococcus sp. SYSU DK003]|uniref:ParA family protein n=1 Tax=Kineococcus sp. SYSU DK003 TaxID=3383124 RepID=UPI003D7DF0BA
MVNGMPIAPAPASPGGGVPISDSQHASTLDADQEAQSRTTTIYTAKGGVGKTTATSHLSGLIAQVPDYRVLAIDLDPQGNLGDDFGLGERGDEGRALTQAVVMGNPLQPILNVRPDLDLVPGGEELRVLSGYLSQQAMTKRDPNLPFGALLRSLRPIAGDYDFIFIDCPPGDEVMHQMALGASRWVLIPTRTDISSRRAVRDVAAQFAIARAAKAPHPLDLLGVVLTGVTSSASALRREAQAAIKEDLGSEDLLMNTVIRYAESIAVGARNRGLLVPELVNAAATAEPWWQAAKEGRPVSEMTRYRSTSGDGLTEDWYALAAEVLGRIGEAETSEREAAHQNDIQEARA